MQRPEREYHISEDGEVYFVADDGRELLAENRREWIREACNQLGLEYDDEYGYGFYDPDDPPFDDDPPCDDLSTYYTLTVWYDNTIDGHFD